jgi:hypothetical protein
VDHYSTDPAALSVLRGHSDWQYVNTSHSAKPPDSFPEPPCTREIERAVRCLALPVWFWFCYIGAESRLYVSDALRQHRLARNERPTPGSN